MLKILEKSWTEFWAMHWRIDDRHRILGIVERGRHLVDFEDPCRREDLPHILQLVEGLRR